MLLSALLSKSHPIPSGPGAYRLVDGSHHHTRRMQSTWWNRRAASSAALFGGDTRPSQLQMLPLAKADMEDQRKSFAFSRPLWARCKKSIHCVARRTVGGGRRADGIDTDLVIMAPSLADGHPVIPVPPISQSHPRTVRCVPRSSRSSGHGSAMPRFSPHEKKRSPPPQCELHQCDFSPSMPSIRARHNSIFRFFHLLLLATAPDGGRR